MAELAAKAPVLEALSMAQDNKPKPRSIHVSDNDNRLVSTALESMSIDSVRRLVIEMEAVILRQTK